MELVMSAFEKFIHLFEATCEKPAIFGIYHIVCLLATLLLCAFLVWKFKDASIRSTRYLVLGFWVVMVTLEILKQLVATFDTVRYGFPVWEFQWNSFPFQFCSTPLYIMPLIVFLPDGWWRRSIIAFFACFSLFAGLTVMIYPGDVFASTAFINIQTMIHHGSMVALGVLMVARNRNHMNKRYFGGSMTIFYSFAVIALILNELVYKLVLFDDPGSAFNMFFISRYYPCTLPLLSNVYNAVPYGWYLVIYFVGFTFASALIYTIEKSIITLSKKIKAKHT